MQNLTSDSRSHPQEQHFISTAYLCCSHLFNFYKLLHSHNSSFSPVLFISHLSWRAVVLVIVIDVIFSVEKWIMNSHIQNYNPWNFHRTLPKLQLFCSFHGLFSTCHYFTLSPYCEQEYVREIIPISDSSESVGNTHVCNTLFTNRKIENSFP